MAKLESTDSFPGNIMVSMEAISSLSISSLEKHLGYWLRRVSNRVSSSFAHSLEAKEASIPEWVVLRYLSEQEETTPGRLAEILMMTRGAISKIVDKLETKDWIECRADVEDTRVRRLSLTRGGRRVLPIMGKIADQNDDHFFGCLTVAERDVFLGMLRKLSDFHQIFVDCDHLRNFKTLGPLHESTPFPFPLPLQVSGKTVRERIS